jgi:uncharacterized protein
VIEKSPGADVGTAGPWPGPQRIVELDALRGFALLGILLINVLGFSGIRTLGVEYEGLDEIILGFLRFFAQAKFLSLFAILFGISFTLQLASLERQGVGIYPTYWRRLGVLFLFGMLHTRLEPSEVLALYALCGAVLILFRKVPAPALLVIALLLMAMPYLHTAIVTPVYIAQPAAGSAPVEQVEENAAESAPVSEEEEMHLWNPYKGPLAVRLHSSGTLSEVVSYNHRFMVRRWTGSWVGYLWMTVPLPLMMVGLLIGRSGVLTGAGQDRPDFRKVFWVGLVAGIGAGWLASHLFGRATQFGWNPWVAFPANWLFSLSGMIMALAYAAGLLVLMKWNIGKWLQATLAPVGRMALTNYLLQTVICVSLFHAYGLGWYGKVGPSQAVLIALGVFAVQVAYSKLWLGAFRYGPVEWLWRVATYWRWLPLKADGKSEKADLA